MSVAATTWRVRKLYDHVQEVRSPERYVDFGIRLHVCERNPEGLEVHPGKPRLHILRSHTFGGLLDTRTRTFVGPSPDPVAWFCSEAQEPFLLHEDDRPPMLLAHGGMGSGKTAILARWLVLRSLEFTGLSGGCVLATAPTTGRLEVLRETIAECMAPEWGEWRAYLKEFRMSTGVPIKLRATKRYSKDGGSPLAGINAFAAGSDEIQDQVVDSEVESELQARGRSAPGGRYRRMATATAKPSSRWRDFLGGLKESPIWDVVHMLGPTNIFTRPEYWENLKHGVPESEYLRILGYDVAPEKQVYNTFERSRNLMPIPQVGARDVTRKWLQGYGSNVVALVGHDPGELYDVSLLLRAYEFSKDIKLKTGTIPARCPIWFVVGEFTTEQTTAEQHAKDLMSWLQNEHGLEVGHYDDPGVVVIADPSSENESKKSPHKSVYRAMRRAGLTRVTSAAPRGRYVPKRAGIDMVRGLFRDSAGHVRLVVAKGQDGKPVAPNLVRALEESVRDDKGEAESQAKNADDLSHWPASLRYGLWPFEKEGGPIKTQLAQMRAAKEAAN